MLIEEASLGSIYSSLQSHYIKWVVYITSNNTINIHQLDQQVRLSEIHLR